MVLAANAHEPLMRTRRGGDRPGRVAALQRQGVGDEPVAGRIERADIR